MIAAFMLAAVCHAASSSDGDELFEQLARSPGVQVREEVAPDGSLEKEILLPSGVAFTRRKLGDKVWYGDEDRTGHGAVLCAWSLYIAIAEALEICGTEQADDLKQELAATIDRINAFVVANNLTPVTKQEIERRVRQERSVHRRSAATMPAEKLTRACASGDTAKMIVAFRSQRAEERRAGLEKLLSVPRPPVLSPCV